jgi:hypothetical protein
MLDALTMWPMQKNTQSEKSFTQNFELMITSLILPRSAQTSTFLYAFSTFQPPRHTKKHGYGTLLVLFVIQ